LIDLTTERDINPDDYIVTQANSEPVLYDMHLLMMNVGTIELQVYSN